MKREIIKMRDMKFDPELFRNYMSGTVLDELLCSYKGRPKGVNHMIDNKIAKAIAPYNEELQMYLDAGYDDTTVQLKQMKASMTVWELYNAVTDYASNNTLWDKEDNRRGMLQGEALKFLMLERDVKNYSDIFSQIHSN